MSAVPGCELCGAASPAGAWQVVAADERLRVLRVLDAAAFPAFYRVVWRAHVAEFSDLGAADRLHCMEAVAAVEQALRQILAPTKINLASLGNVVPHLHWHVLARFAWDSHFPAPIWAAAQRPSPGDATAQVASRLAAVDAAIVAGLAGLTPGRG